VNHPAPVRAISQIQKDLNIMQTSQRTPPLPPEKSLFSHSEDFFCLLEDASCSLHCVIKLLEVNGFDVEKHLNSVRRDDLAGLLRLVGIKIEHAQAVYAACVLDKPQAANQR
jgi:hypothetical protein